MIHSSTPHRRARWRPARQYLRSAASSELWDWLLDPGSLTHRLRQRCGEGFRVALRRQRWGRAAADERRLLGMAPAERALLREVHLLCGDTPWVFARTVMPVSSLGGRRRRLARLGNRPLGAALFSEPSLRRGALEVACLQPGGEIYGRALGTRAGSDSIWGRRSVFHLQERPLLVTEIFLPALWQAPVQPAVLPCMRRVAGAG